jgi:hypothetical protein
MAEGAMDLAIRLRMQGKKLLSLGLLEPLPVATRRLKALLMGPIPPPSAGFPSFGENAL